MNDVGGGNIGKRGLDGLSSLCVAVAMDAVATKLL